MYKLISFKLNFFASIIVPEITQPKMVPSRAETTHPNMAEDN